MIAVNSPAERRHEELLHSPRAHVLLAIEAAVVGRSRCECGFIGLHAEVQEHLAGSIPPRRMPDGTPCWCISEMEPHDGWIHSEYCSGVRRLARAIP